MASWKECGDCQAEELRALIEAIEDGPVTRELEDRVLLALDWQPGNDRDMWWRAPGTVYWRSPPRPLTSLEDAKLADPPEWIRIDMHEYKDHGACLIYLPVGTSHSTAPTLPKARVLAGLRARLVEMEQ